VINRQLDRVAEARSSVFKATKWDVSSSVSYSRLLDYLSALEALHALLLPELKDDVREILSSVKYLAYKYSKCREEKDCERLVAEEIGELANKYGLQYKMLSFYVLFDLCDKALEIMMTNLNRAGLLMRGKIVKLGTARG